MHEGHRERMRNKFRKGALEDHELLELLLFFSIPRSNTNEIAHTLLDRFGSIKNVFERREEVLKQVDGIGDNSAILIRLVAELSRRYWLQTCDTTTLLQSKRDLYQFLHGIFLGECHECVYIIMFNKKNKYIDCVKISEGRLDSTSFSPLIIAKTVNDNKASKIILAHNHPSGDPTPSMNDIDSTKKLEKMFDGIGIKLIDHYVVGKNCCTSVFSTYKDQK